MFSSIESGKYLHLSDGRVYEISITATAGDSNLKEYTLSDIRLEQESGGYNNGSVSSSYTLYYKDGKREYFSSDGKLIGIRDRFENTIKFVNDTLNGYPRITITDTLNRVTTISGQATTSGHTMTVALPESISLTYTIEHNTNTVACDELAMYEDAMDIPTHYSYTISSGGFDVYSKSTSAATNYFVNLTTITHPTNAQTVFSFEQVTRNLGSSGLMICYRLHARVDKIGTTEYNAKTYSYSSNNNTGYPAYSDPSALPEAFSYSTTVTTTANGVSTTSTFNNKHCRVTVETKQGTTIFENIQIQYNDDKLPNRVTSTKYNLNNQNLTFQTITATAYDNKANVTGSWSPLANGDTTNTEYKTTYAYDDTHYSILTGITYKQDASTTILKQYTLDPSYKKVMTEAVYVNSELKSKTDYSYDSFGNVDTKKAYKDDFVAYILTDYDYDNNAYLSDVKTSGVQTVDNVLVESTPGYTNGTIVTQYQYDNLGRLTHSIDARGYTTIYAYNNKNDLTSVTNPDNSVKQYNRNYTSNYVVTTDEEGVQKKVTYTALGLEYEVIDVLTNTVMSRKAYDSLSRLSSITDFVLNNVTTYTYDNLSRITSETTSRGATVLSSASYAYEDACDGAETQKVTKTIHGETNAPSIVSTQYTDKMGNVVKAGRILNTVEKYDTYLYDYVGNKIQEKSARAYDPNDDLTQLVYTGKWEYDYAGKVIKQYNSLGDYATMQYNSLGQLVSATDYKANKLTTPYSTTYQYDALGRKVKESIPFESNGGTIYYSIKKHFYDQNGNITKESHNTNLAGTQEQFASTRYSYNSRNMLTNVITHPETVDETTSYTYDGVGNKTSMTIGTSVTEYHYNNHGMLDYTIDPLDMVESYTYDLYGNMLTKTDRNGAVTVYARDGLGRVTSETVTDDGVQTGQTSYDYYKTCQLKSLANSNVTTTYCYDDLGRKITETETGGIVKEYEYNLADLRKKYTLKQNGTTRQITIYSYDYLNRMTYVYENGTQVAQYTYDVNGNRDLLIYANGIVEDYDYNLANMVTLLVNRKDAQTLTSFTYTYYLDGNQASKVDNTNRRTDYTYDGLGRLKQEAESGAADAITKGYVYDANGNRDYMTVTGAEVYNVDYEYDDNNRLSYEEKTLGTTTVRTDYYYDNNGNTITKNTSTISESTAPEELELTLDTSGVEFYTYDGFNRLVGVKNDAGTHSYTYRPDGLRNTKTVNGATTKHIWDGQNISFELDGSGNVLDIYTRGINLIKSSVNGYYLYNAHCDVVQLTNSSGTVYKNYSYDAFGNEKGISAADPNPFRYCGEYYDKEAGTIYLRARYYDPAIGRFISEDSYLGNNSSPLSLNLYTYCYNNPVSLIDYSGHHPDWPRYIPFFGWGYTLGEGIAHLIYPEDDWGGEHDWNDYANDMMMSTWVTVTFGQGILQLGFTGTESLSEVAQTLSALFKQITSGVKSSWDQIFSKGTSNTQWYKADGSLNYPPNNGAVVGSEVTITLQKGQSLGRYGNVTPKSDYVTAPGASPSSLSLPPNTSSSIYSEYVVVKPIPNTVQSIVAPWGGDIGGGLQYKLPMPIEQCKRQVGHHIVNEQQG